MKCCITMIFYFQFDLCFIWVKLIKFSFRVKLRLAGMVKDESIDHNSLNHSNYVNVISNDT